MNGSSLPSPSDVQYFVEVARTENMSRAAERIGISQPSLSQAMQRLESCVGTVLLLRSKKGVTLTQAGKQLYSHANELLQSWDSIKGKALASANKVQGSFTIGCHAAVARSAGAYFMPRLMEDNPDLNIRFHHNLSRKITNDVISLKIDIGIVVNPVAHPDLIIRPLCRDYISFWVNAEHDYPLQNTKDGQAVLICDPQLVQSQSLIKQMAKNKIAYRRVIESSDLSVISELTCHGCGIGVMPESTAMKARYPLKRLTKAPSYDDEHCLIYRVENKNIRAIQLIADAVSQYYVT